MIGPKRTPLTKAEERDAYEIVTHRDAGTCQRCRRPGLYVERDHRQGRDAFNTTPANLQLLCGPFSAGGGCHQWKTEHPAEALADGWTVPRSAGPSEWPARRFIRTGLGTLRPAWVLYLDDGTWVEIAEFEAHERMGREVT